MPSTLRQGSKGEEVKLLQTLLNKHGFKVTVDGDFGPGTRRKVVAFQESKYLTPDGIVGGGTWGALQAPEGEALVIPTALQGMVGDVPAVVARLKKLGYAVSEEDWVLNLFGIRSPTVEANSFDDILGVAYKADGEWKVRFWPGTTDPGTYHLQHPSKVEGTAMLVEGQYAAWKIDMHGGKYEALCQRAAKVKVYRDADRNNQLDRDPSTIEEGWFGINLHRSSLKGESKTVDKWSAGCQVHARLDCFNEMMRLAHQQVDKTGKEVFTYTLLKQWF
jgi:hypothetical protein